MALPDQPQTDIIHVGNVCVQCGEWWETFHEEMSSIRYAGKILAPMITIYNEVPVDDCEGEGEGHPAGTDDADAGQTSG